MTTSDICGRLDRRAVDPSERADPQVFVDTVCNWPPALKLTLDFFGVDKLMLGSDHPFWPMSMATEVLDSLHLSPVDRAKIEYENAARLFQLPVTLTSVG